MDFQVDSFRPRGISSVCTYSGNPAADILRRRVVDAYAAKRYLASLPFVAPGRIAVKDWSHGGSTTLQVLSSKTADPFRATVAFCPGCRSPLTGLNAPLLILIGGADDLTPADRCEAMMPREPAAAVTLKVYPGPTTASTPLAPTGIHRDPEACTASNTTPRPRRTRSCRCGPS